MARRRTTIGKGAFGHWVPSDQHAWEGLQRILSRGHPLTEDAVFLCMWNVLRRNGSKIFQKVRSSSDMGGYRYFRFPPDIDLLEVRPNNIVVGYELKGYRRKAREMVPPIFYEGIDQALAYLVNPVGSPDTDSFIGSIFDQVYLVHPAGSEVVQRLAGLLQRCTPIGLIEVDPAGTKEIVKPTTNPYVSSELKEHFLSRLDTFSTYLNYKVNPVQ